MALVRDLLEQHPHQDVLLATHGSLLTLILNGFDDKFGYDFWRTLTFPDVYELTFRDGILTRVRRRWEEAA